MTKSDARDDAADSIVVECDLAEPPEKVWRALTVPDLLAAWLMPNDIRPEIGRRFTLQAPGAKADGTQCEVLAVEPNRLISYRWRSADSERDASGRSLDSVVTFVLTETETGGTHLRLVHEGFPASLQQPETRSVQAALRGFTQAVGNRAVSRAKAERDAREAPGRASEHPDQNAAGCLSRRRRNGDEQSDELRPHGGRAIEPRRARLRHLLAPAEGADRLPERARRRRHGSALVCAQLLFLESENPKKEISMYINSPGGIVTSGLAIYDTMQYIKSPVSTLCMGMAASMGSFLLMAGAEGQRIALPNARIMVHQPSGGFQGQASDIERHAEDIIKTKRRLNELYAKHCGRTLEEVEQTLDRDHFMTAEEAKAWGIVDHVCESREISEAA